MNIGASTSNLYPMLTEDALACLLKLDFRSIEVFINTESEAEPVFSRSLRRQAEAVGASIHSLHPYVSGTEPYLLFSAYERRFRDGLKIYERIFQSAAEMGASFVIMHGDKANGILPVEESIGRFETLYDLGRQYGVTLAQENVFRFRSSDNAYLRAMRNLLGDKAHFVLDFKQCVRCGHTVEEVMDAMGPSIVHVHISDQDEDHDCLLPGRGRLDYPVLFHRLKSCGFDGTLMLELYRCNFQNPEDLADGRRKLEEFVW